MKAVAIWYFEIGWLPFMLAYGLWALMCGAWTCRAGITTKDAAVKQMPAALLLAITPPVLIGGILFLIKHW